MPPPSALLFDLDGTLVDSHHEISVALEKTLIDHGFELGLAAAKALVDGSGLEIIWLKLDANHRADAAFERFAASYRAHYQVGLGLASPPFPGVIETLARLRLEQPAVTLCVVSNKAESSAHALLEKSGVSGHFRLTVGTGPSRPSPKPAPGLLLYAAQQLALPAERCVMIGDTIFDVQAGKRAGMRTVAVSYGMSTREALLREAPDHLVDDFNALYPLIDELCRA